MKIQPLNGAGELRAARRQSRRIYWSVGVFSFFVNALMFSGPIYMMQVYDRVLGSGSEATLLVLSLLLAFIYLIMGLLDHIRARLLARAGARFQSALDKRVFRAMIRRSSVAQDPLARSGLDDLEAVRRLLASPVVAAGFDLPWTPLFLAVITAFHPLLGMLALGGGLVLIGLAALNQLLTRGPQQQASKTGQLAGFLSEEIRAEAETIRATGMLSSAFYRWKTSRDAALRDGMVAGSIGGGFSTAIKMLRMLLQSAMLGLGAWLVLQGDMTAGSMLAGSVMMGRALAPIEQGISQWDVLQRALKGWSNLSALLSRVPAEDLRTALPRPSAKIEVEGLGVAAPGAAGMQLRKINFRLEPGQVLGVIGASGAGKSTLARAMTGVWPATAGAVRLDGAAIGQYNPDELGAHLGFLPQRVQLFDGSIAENIARLSGSPDPNAVVAAAKLADAHAMIVGLPEGYDTRVGPAGAGLSGGQMQRIALARALYGDPVAVLLDEPNSSLDTEGVQALNRAIRAMKSAGKAVIIMTHRPAGLQECDLVLALDDGNQAAFGPRDEVLRKSIRSTPQPKSLMTGEKQCA